MITYEKLDQIVRYRFEVMGLRSCRDKASFLFALQSVYGESLDIEDAGEIYSKVKAELIQKEEDLYDN